MHNTPLKEGSPSWLLLVELKKRVEKVLEQNSVLNLKDLAINGKDLIASGIPSGKCMGAILQELFETVTDSPDMNQKEKLLSLAQNIYKAKYQ